MYLGRKYKFRGFRYDIYILKEDVGLCTSGSREELYNLPTDTALIGTYSHATCAMRRSALSALLALGEKT